MTSSTALGMPTMPPREGRAVTGAISFTSGHYFSPAEGADPAVLAEAATAPLSVIVQVTKRCDFGCMFCSETLPLPDPALTRLGDDPGQPRGRTPGVPVWRGAAAAPRSGRHREHVLGVYYRVANERDPRRGDRPEAGGKDRVREHRVRRAASHLPPGARRLQQGHDWRAGLQRRGDPDLEVGGGAAVGNAWTAATGGEMRGHPPSRADTSIAPALPPGQPGT